MISPRHLAEPDGGVGLGSLVEALEVAPDYPLLLLPRPAGGASSALGPHGRCDRVLTVTDHLSGDATLDVLGGSHDPLSGPLRRQLRRPVPLKYTEYSGAGRPCIWHRIDPDLRLSTPAEHI
ncbi:MAG: hypothetical protein OEZ06_25030 [Myxococcales bacterium]|nr:hypothetical protein [Myxococcales bacterium]